MATWFGLLAYVHLTEDDADGATGGYIAFVFSVHRPADEQRQSDLQPVGLRDGRLAAFAFAGIMEKLEAHFTESIFGSACTRGEENRFDPMGLSLADDARWIRKAELYHARGCMFAAVTQSAIFRDPRVPEALQHLEVASATSPVLSYRDPVSSASYVARAQPRLTVVQRHLRDAWRSELQDFRLLSGDILTAGSDYDQLHDWVTSTFAVGGALRDYDALRGQPGRWTVAHSLGALLSISEALKAIDAPALSIFAAELCPIVVYLAETRHSAPLVCALLRGARGLLLAGVVTAAIERASSVELAACHAATLEAAARQWASHRDAATVRWACRALGVSSCGPRAKLVHRLARSVLTASALWTSAQAR